MNKHVGNGENGEIELKRTGSGSTTGGLEAAVLDGGGGVIINEGHGLGEIEETAMMVSEESWTRFGVALWDASEPALNTGRHNSGL